MDSTPQVWDPTDYPDPEGALVQHLKGLPAGAGVRLPGDIVVRSVVIKVGPNFRRWSVTAPGGNGRRRPLSVGRGTVGGTVKTTVEAAQIAIRGNKT